MTRQPDDPGVHPWSDWQDEPYTTTDIAALVDDVGRPSRFVPGLFFVLGIAAWFVVMLAAGLVMLALLLLIGGAS